MPLRYYSLVVFCLSALSLSSAATGQSFYVARFTPEQQSQTVTSSGAATAAMVLTDDGLRFVITADGLSGDIAAAHFHRGLPGTDGPVVRTLTADFTAGSASGTWTSGDSEPFTSEMRESLAAGELYINLHTAAHAAGEIRGQVLPASGTALTARLTPQQEPQGSTGTGAGTATVLLTDSGAAFHITVDGLTAPIAAAHFHTAPLGANGGVARTITSDFDGNTAFGYWTALDGEPLSDALRTALLTGGIYLNVHTSTNPGGEIRGQLNLSSGIGFSALLDADQETGDVTSSARGSGALTLTNAGLVFSFAVEGLSGPIAAAHLHNAAIGSDGPVVRTLTGEFDNGHAVGIWRSDDSEPLTPELISALLRGELYINVHTATYGSGEIRGQVEMNQGASFTATFTSAQQTGAVESNGYGTGTFILAEDDLDFSISVDSLVGDFTAAHFHRGLPGVSGGVVRTLTADFSGGTAEDTWRSDDAEPLTDELIEALLNGELYVNVHTTAFGSGEIRGQVVLSAGSALFAQLSPEQETADVTSDASGTGWAILTREGAQYAMTVSELTGPIAAAHFHGGATGANGGVRKTITTRFAGSTATGTWLPSDGEPLDAAAVTALTRGDTYFNVHTAAFGSGEVRGQLVLSDGVGGIAQLDPGQEVSTVSSSGSGTAVTTWSDAGLIFDMTATALTGSIAAAHFHSAPPRTNGSVVRTISGDLVDNSARGLWRGTDTEPLTVTELGDLLAGDLYINVHTAAFGSGEIRGQIGANAVTLTNTDNVKSTYADDTIALLGNYPNPFSTHTTIRFALSQSEHVGLEVYDMLGRRVAQVAEARFSEGTHEIQFVPADYGARPSSTQMNNQNGIQSGVYVYRLSAGGHTYHGVMTVLK